MNDVFISIGIKPSTRTFIVITIGNDKDKVRKDTEKIIAENLKAQVDSFEVFNFFSKNLKTNLFLWFAEYGLVGAEATQAMRALGKSLQTMLKS